MPFGGGRGRISLKMKPGSLNIEKNIYVDSGWTCEVDEYSLTEVTVLCRSVSCSQCTPLPLRRLSQPDALSWCCHPLVSLRSASLRVCSLEDVRSERYCVILATLHGRQLTSSEPEVTRQCLVGCQQHAHQSLPW